MCRIIVNGQTEFNDRDWQAALRQFLKELEAPTAAVTRSPSLKFGDIVLRLAPKAGIYCVSGPEIRGSEKEIVSGCKREEQIFIMSSERIFVEMGIREFANNTTAKLLILMLSETPPVYVYIWKTLAGLSIASYGTNAIVNLWKKETPNPAVAATS